MANYSKSSGFARFWAVFMTILLAASIFFGIVTEGFKNWNPDDWFDKKEEQPLPEENGGAVITEGESNGIKLKSVKIAPEDYAANGISPMAETAFQLTATITPENATNKAVDWTIGFVNPSSEWATGKTVTEYVTVTPTADGALTATVENLQAFGEQIKVTVTSRDNAAATANATVDYTQKLSSVKATFGSTVLTNGMTKSFDLSKSGQAAETWNFDYTSSAYTIADEYTTTVRISFTDNAAGIGNTIGSVLIWSGEDITSGIPSFDKTFFDKVFMTISGAVSNNPEMFNKLVMVLTGNPSDPGMMLFEVKVSTVGTYGSKTDTYEIKVLPDGLSIRVEDVELGDTSIIF